MFEFVVETYAPPQTTIILPARVEELALAAAQVSEAGAEVILLSAVFCPRTRPASTSAGTVRVGGGTVRAAAARGRLHLERLTEPVSITTPQTGSPAGSQPPTNP